MNRSVKIMAFWVATMQGFWVDADVSEVHASSVFGETMCFYLHG
jgi:hypothetical protein